MLVRVAVMVVPDGANVTRVGFEEESRNGVDPYRRYAEAFGGLGLRIERDADIAPALAAALAHPGIAVVAVAVSREAIAVGQTLSRVSPRPA